jgi:hypothetical protein
VVHVALLAHTFAVQDHVDAAAHAAGKLIESLLLNNSPPRSQSSSGTPPQPRRSLHHEQPTRASLGKPPLNQSWAVLRIKREKDIEVFAFFEVAKLMLTVHAWHSLSLAG